MWWDNTHAHTYTVTLTCSFFPNVILMNHSGFRKAAEDTLILLRQGFSSSETEFTLFLSRILMRLGSQDKYRA